MVCRKRYMSNTQSELRDEYCIKVESSDTIFNLYFNEKGFTTVDAGSGHYFHSDGLGVSKMIEEVDRVMNQTKEKYKQQINGYKRIKKVLSNPRFIEDITNLLK